MLILRLASRRSGSAVADLFRGSQALLHAWFVSNGHALKDGAATERANACEQEFLLAEWRADGNNLAGRRVGLASSALKLVPGDCLMRTHHSQKRRFVFNRIAFCILVVWLVTVLLLAAPSAEGGSQDQSDGKIKKISFNDTIQPILSENCYACHGPDPGARKAGLRLDRGEFAFAPHQDAHEKYAPAIIPGNAEKSPLVRRIENKNAKDRMPPPEAHKTLKPEQIALLREWVKQGAQYEELWSFLPPKYQAIPAVTHGEWVRNGIDNFVLARLEKEGLTPSPEADRRSLIRRVTYDLTGVPPTPEEVEAFVANSAPDAYERVVERLLSSPRYGEHRAHYWLDVARDGGTHGVHLGKFQSILADTDYVNRAYNQNKPFDQF